MNPAVKAIIGKSLEVVSWERDFAVVRCPSGKDHPDCLCFANGHVHDFHTSCEAQPVFRYSTLISTIFSVLDFASGVFARGVRPAGVQKGL